MDKFVELARFFFVFFEQDSYKQESSPFHYNSFMRLYFKCLGRIVFIPVSQLHLREQIPGLPRSRKLLLSVHLFCSSSAYFYFSVKLCASVVRLVHGKLYVVLSVPLEVSLS